MVMILTGCGKHEITPLAAAARTGDIAAIRSLIRGGAAPNEGSGVNGWTPLMHAIHKRQAAAAFALVEEGADANLACCGTTALAMAAGYGQAEIVRGLLQRGANPRQKLSGGRTALDYAISGVVDIDNVTLGKCQATTVSAILEWVPDLPAVDRPGVLARLRGGCPEVERLLRSRAVAKR